MPALRSARLFAALAGCLLLAGFGIADEPKKPAAAKSAGDIKKDLHQLALAMHRYETAFGHLPPAAIRDKNGKPLLSWRVLALPYVGEEKLYKDFLLDEPWDSDHNKKLIARMPAIFRGPNTKLNEQFKTVYLAPVEASTVFPPDGRHVKLGNIFDGTANTIMLVEANDDSAVTWTKPADLRVDLTKPFHGLERPADGFFTVVMCDGYAQRMTSLGNPVHMERALACDDGLGRVW